APLEPHAPSGEAVEGRRAGVILAIRTQRVRAQRVDRHEEHAEPGVAVHGERGGEVPTEREAGGADQAGGEDGEEGDTPPFPSVVRAALGGRRRRLWLLPRFPAHSLPAPPKRPILAGGSPFTARPGSAWIVSSHEAPRRAARRRSRPFFLRRRRGEGAGTGQAPRLRHRNLPRLGARVRRRQRRTRNARP